jgi:SSS family solute:Na+ symporter
VFYVLRDFHGIAGLRAALPPDLSHTWKGLNVAQPFGSAMDVAGIVFGLGFVLSCGYWCTDFLLVQRALAARDVTAASQTPLIGAAAKLFFPALVVIPGLAAIILIPKGLAERYDLALPTLMSRYYGHGLLGLGVVAMLSSFMSGMAGNITAFNTVWTYDLYQSYIARDRSDSHYITVGRVATVVATILSIGTAFIVLRFNSLMDYVQLLFSFFNAPLFATFLLGMFTKWATPSGGFWGLLLGTLASVLHHALYSARILPYGSDMSANFYGAMAGWSVCFVVTTAVSMVTTKKPAAELAGLVYVKRAQPAEGQNILWVFAAAILAVCIALNWWLW